MAECNPFAELIATNHSNVTKDKLLEWQATWQHFCDEEMGYQVRVSPYYQTGALADAKFVNTGSGFKAATGSAC